MLRIGIGIGIDFPKKVRRVLVKDTFTRADNAATLGNTESGQAWTAMDATVWGIGTNAAKIVSGNGRVVLNAGRSDNFALQVKFSTIASGSNIQRIVFRYIDSSNELYFGKATATQYQLSKRVAGTVTTLATINQTPTSGDIIQIEVRGANIIAKINGVIVANVNDAANVTGTNVGLYTADTIARYDDFIVEAL